MIRFSAVTFLSHPIPRRIGWTLLAFWVGITLVFLVPRLGPENPAAPLVHQLESQSADPSTLTSLPETFRKEFLLDKALPMQYLHFLGCVGAGDLGYSAAQYPTPVSGLLLGKLWQSLFILIPSLVLGWILGNLLGAWTSLRSSSIRNPIFHIVGIVSAAPAFVYALILVDFIPHHSAFVIGGLLTFIIVCSQAFRMQNQVRDEISSPYIFYARSLGISEPRILLYLLQSGTRSRLKRFARDASSIWMSLLVCEIVLEQPGLGTLLMDALRQYDFPLLQGIAIIMLGILLIGSLLVECLLPEPPADTMQPTPHRIQHRTWIFGLVLLIPLLIALWMVNSPTTLFLSPLLSTALGGTVIATLLGFLASLTPAPFKKLLRSLLSLPTLLLLTLFLVGFPAPSSVALAIALGIASMPWALPALIHDSPSWVRVFLALAVHTLLLTLALCILRLGADQCNLVGPGLLPLLIALHLLRIP